MSKKTFLRIIEYIHTFYYCLIEMYLKSLKIFLYIIRLDLFSRTDINIYLFIHILSKWINYLFPINPIFLSIVKHEVVFIIIIILHYRLKYNMLKINNANVPIDN